jgi:neutral trehalase
VDVKNGAKFLSILPSDDEDKIKFGANEQSLFYDYDLVAERQVKKKTVASLIPIYTGLIPRQEAEVILRWSAALAIDMINETGIGIPPS